jgi:hypothetical protein
MDISSYADRHEANTANLSSADGHAATGISRDYSPRRYPARGLGDDVAAIIPRCGTVMEKTHHGGTEASAAVVNHS